jgi:hypothetical protein
MAQLSFVCSWFAFSIGWIGMNDTTYPRGQWGIWLGWKAKIAPRRFEKKWEKEWIRVI